MTNIPCNCIYFSIIDFMNDWSVIRVQCIAKKFDVIDESIFIYIGIKEYQR